MESSEAVTVNIENKGSKKKKFTEETRQQILCAGEISYPAQIEDKNYSLRSRIAQIHKLTDLPKTTIDKRIFELGLQAVEQILENAEVYCG